jgi:tryptophanyl-tRNA synthetase
MKKRVFSGIQPSGDLHLGNYLGALKRWVDAQEETDNIFCIVDMHAITVPQDPTELRIKIRELAAIYFAAGLDPEKSTVFVQSDISAHAELGWILNCFTPTGWLNRMTQFKDKAGDQQESVSTGLYDYPVLMAADILLYQTDEVPVGEDQKQHVELTRDIAQRFNSIYGETFKLPEPKISQIAARVMSLDDPTKKMSKSNPSANSRINLLDDPELIRSKVMKATTDSEGIVKFDESRPGVYNLLEIYENLTGKSRQEIEQHFAGKGYGDFKKEVAETVVEALKPLQEKYRELMANPETIEKMLQEGANKIRPMAEETLQQVKTKVGLGTITSLSS